MGRACPSPDVYEGAGRASSGHLVLIVDKITRTAEPLTVRYTITSQRVHLPAASRLALAAEIVLTAILWRKDHLLVDIVGEVALIDQWVEVDRLRFGNVNQERAL